MYPMNPTNPFGNGLYNPYINPVNQFNQYVPNYPALQPDPPHREIDRVNGKEAAFQFPMGPNSSVILADTMLPKIWVVTTDSAGSKIVKGMTVIPDEDEQPKQEQPAQEVEPEKQEEKEDPFAKIYERLDRIEERMRSYGKSDNRSNVPVKSNTAERQQTVRVDEIAEQPYVSASATSGK